MPPLGLTFTETGANLAVYSRSAATIFLCLFDGDAETHRIPLAKQADIHHAHTNGLKPGTRYGLRAEGPTYDPAKLLLDPYATSIDRAYTYDDRLAQPGIDTASLVPKSVATKPLSNIAPRPLTKPDVIYELQVRAFTKCHPDIPETIRGTIAALANPAIIAHLKHLGVDTIELMPITAWIDERHLAKLGLRNAWGYNPVSFFAPDPRLAPGGLQEVRDTIATLHANGFNVILDMVFNHSGEGDAEGPTLCYRGLDSASYYAHHNGDLINDTGCGNTFALNHEPMLSLAIASLRHWVLQAGFDGFRFDLATIMGRTETGFSPSAPLLQAIENDPVLSTRIMIAEPWDIGPGGYQLGQFPKRWLEWNDRFRDDARRFWRGDEFSSNAMATRLAGSSDVFTGTRSRSVNFIAAHDGFTIRDLTIYDQKNNLANGENNRDGKNNEVACINTRPENLLATLLLSRGTAMITAGDEFGRTQAGNNNAYAQDNETTWLDWQNADKALIEKVATLIAQRKSVPIFDDLLEPSSADWLDGNNNPINWADPNNPVLTLKIRNNYSVTLNRNTGSVSLSTKS